MEKTCSSNGGTQEILGFLGKRKAEVLQNPVPPRHTHRYSTRGRAAPNLPKMPSPFLVQKAVPPFGNWMFCKNRFGRQPADRRYSLTVEVDKIFCRISWAKHFAGNLGLASVPGQSNINLWWVSPPGAGGACGAAGISGILVGSEVYYWELWDAEWLWEI